jgi:hypothetical protein
MNFHRVTWLFIVAGVLSLLGDLFDAGLFYRALRSVGDLPESGMGDLYARIAHGVGYSLSLFGFAGIAEVLVRIARALKAPTGGVEG